MFSTKSITKLLDLPVKDDNLARHLAYESPQLFQLSTCFAPIISFYTLADRDNRSAVKGAGMMG